MGERERERENELRRELKKGKMAAHSTKCTYIPPPHTHTHTPLCTNNGSEYIDINRLVRVIAGRHIDR